jgi:hypothetical protein
MRPKLKRERSDATAATTLHVGVFGKIGIITGEK